MAEQLNQCPVCAATQIAEQYHHRDSRGATWHVFKCASCTHGFINPMPSWSELDPYYHSTYNAYTPAHGAHDPDEEVIKTAIAKGEFRHTRIQPGMRVLDVGCGGGYFLKIVAGCGVIAEGVEPSEHGVATARKAGLNVYHGTVENYLAENPDKRFDTITAHHVLEHVPRPLESLTAIKRLLAPDGTVVIMVPNANCYACRSLKGRWHSTDLPRHVMQFTTQSLETVGKQVGLRVTQSLTYTLPKSVAGSARLWLRHRLLIPGRLTRRISAIDRRLAPWLAPRLDRRGTGEAILVYFAHQ